MKVVGLVGSPKANGNSAELVNAVLAGAKNKGAQTCVFQLNDLNIRGCQGCAFCETHEECAVKDDMQKIYQEINDADAVVIGSPVYMTQMSAQTKLVIDRFCAYSGRMGYKIKGKKLLFVFAQEEKNTQLYKPYFDNTEEFCSSFFGFSVEKTIVASGVVKQQPDVLKKAETAGEALAVRAKR